MCRRSGDRAGAAASGIAGKHGSQEEGLGHLLPSSLQREDNPADIFRLLASRTIKK